MPSILAESGFNNFYRRESPIGEIRENPNITNSFGFSDIEQIINDSSIDIHKLNPLFAGQRTWNNGTGFWLGIVGGVPKFSIGDGLNNYFTYDGLSIALKGDKVVFDTNAGQLQADVANLIDDVIGENVTAGDVLYLKESDNKWYITDASNPSTAKGRAVAFESGIANATIKIQIGGLVTNVSGISLAGLQYISNVSGEVSNSPGSYERIIGYSPDGVNMIIFTQEREMPRYFVLYTGAMPTGTYGYTDDFDIMISSTTTTLTVYDARSGGDKESRNFTSDWADADKSAGTAKIGEYIYLCLSDNATSTNRVYRYLANDLASGGTLMSGTIGDGTEQIDSMISDGTYLYFNNNGGDEVNVSYKWEKWSISGTTLSFVSDITCGASDTTFSTSAGMDKYGNFYGVDSVDGKVRRYDSSGTLQATSSSTLILNLYSIEGIMYATTNSGVSNFFVKLSLQP